MMNHWDFTIEHVDVDGRNSEVHQQSISFQYSPQSWGEDKSSKMGRIKQRTARMQAVHHIYILQVVRNGIVYRYMSIYICMHICCNILQLYHNTESLLMTTTNWRMSFNHHHVSPCNPMMMQTETVSPNFNTANPRCPPPKVCRLNGD